MEGATVIGIDLGGTKAASALFDQEGNLLAHGGAALEQRSGPAVGALLRQLIDELLEAAGRSGQKPGVVGVGVPGIFHSDTGRVWAPNIPGWEDYPLSEELTSHFPALQVRIDSDRACYILGEVWKGAARGCREAVFLAVGTGIGAGILVGGQILRGAHDIAGAVGWMPLSSKVLSDEGAAVHFEHHASGPGLVTMAREMMQKTGQQLNGIKPEALQTSDIFTAAAKGDPLAKQVLRAAIEYWGKAVATLVSIFNPEKVIFGGGVFGPARVFLPDIYAEALKWAQPISIRQVKLEASVLGGEAGLYGAAYLALRTL